MGILYFPMTMKGYHKSFFIHGGTYENIAART